MSDTDTVQVVLNAQQLALLDAIREDEDLGTRPEALRHGLRAFLEGTATP